MQSTLNLNTSVLNKFLEMGPLRSREVRANYFPSNHQQLPYHLVCNYLTCNSFISPQIGELSAIIPETLKAQVELGSVYCAKRKYGEARTVYQEVLGEYEKTFGDRHVETRRLMGLLIAMLFKISELPTAVNMIHMSVKRTIAASGSGSKEAIEITELYASQLIKLEQYADADTVYMKLYNSSVSEMGLKDINTLNIALKIGNLHFNSIKNYNFAVSMYQRALTGFIEFYGAENPITINTQNLLENAQAKQKAKLKK